MLPLPPPPPPQAVAPVPQNLEAERYVLGALILDPGWIGDIVKIVKPDDFYLAAHQEIFRAIVDMHGRGQSIEILLLGEELKRRGRYDEAGGYVALASLEQSCVSPGAAPEMAEKVVNAAATRHMVRQMDETKAALMSGGDAFEHIDLLTVAAGRIRSAGAFRVDSEMPAPLTEFAGVCDVPFPLECLPPQIAEFCQQLAEATQTRVDLAAVSALGTLAGCCQGKAVISVDYSWSEPLCLFTVVVAETGERKGPVWSAVMRPIKAHESKMRKDAARAAKEYERKAKILKKKRSRFETAVSKNEDDSDKELEAVEAELEALVMPHSGCMVIQDSTPEAIADAMANNGGCIILADSEGTVFANMLGRYNSGAPNVGNILKGWSGEQIRVNRMKNKEQIVIDNPHISAVMSVQPTIVRGMGNQDVSDQGFHARWLFTLPPSMVGRRKTKPALMDSVVAEGYNASLERLLSIPVADPAPELHLTPDAEAELRGYMKRLDRGSVPGGAYYPIKGWALKAHGQAARIAGLLHMFRFAGSAQHHKIDLATVKAAVTIMNYFTVHAGVAYRLMGIEQQSTTGDARRLLEWMLETGERFFTTRRVHRKTHNWYSSTRRDAALARLVDKGYLIVQEERDPTRKGRPKGTSYTLSALAEKAAKETGQPGAEALND